jgi:RNA polymerase sigma factor (sigma-70 family)
MATDRELFDAWCDGDTKAANELFERHARALFWFFRTKVGDAAAEDLLQETFLACIKNRDGFRHDAEFRTYLFAAARSRLINHLQRVAPREARIEPEATSLADLGVSFGSVLDKQAADRRLLAALRQLPLDLQIAIELFYFEELRGEEVADVLGVPRPTARRRLQLARKQLREALARVGEDPSAIETTITDLQSWARRLRER